MVKLPLADAELPTLSVADAEKRVTPSV